MKQAFCFVFDNYKSLFFVFLIMLINLHDTINNVKNLVNFFKLLMLNIFILIIENFRYLLSDYSHGMS